MVLTSCSRGRWRTYAQRRDRAGAACDALRRCGLRWQGLPASPHRGQCHTLQTTPSMWDCRCARTLLPLPASSSPPSPPSQVWQRCAVLYWAEFKPGSSGAMLGEVEVMQCVQEVCVLALLHWAATWSRAGELESGEQLAVVTLMLERSLVLVHMPPALHTSRDNWHAEEEQRDNIAAVWLEERSGALEWTVVQQQQQQHSALLLKLNILAGAVNEFPQFPALRNLGDVWQQFVLCDV